MSFYNHLHRPENFFIPLDPLVNWDSSPKCKSMLQSSLHRQYYTNLWVADFLPLHKVLEQFVINQVHKDDVVFFFEYILIYKDYKLGLDELALISSHPYCTESVREKIIQNLKKKEYRETVLRDWEKISLLRLHLDPTILNSN
ncbi:MAG: hypothetical protein ACYCQJ_12435 [Nitrososphaerales archaeon]